MTTTEIARTMLPGQKKIEQSLVSDTANGKCRPVMNGDATTGESHTPMDSNCASDTNGLISNRVRSKRGLFPVSLTPPKSETPFDGHHPDTIITFLTTLPKRVNIAAGQRAASFINRILSSRRSASADSSGDHASTATSTHSSFDGKNHGNGIIPGDSSMDVGSSDGELQKGINSVGDEGCDDQQILINEWEEFGNRSLGRTLTVRQGPCMRTVSAGYQRVGSFGHGNGTSGERRGHYLGSFPTPSLPCSPLTSPRTAALLRPINHIRKVNSVTLDTGYVKLNQYKLMKEIGQGSYGIVKLAYNEEDNNHYAMKILDKKKLMKKFAFFRKPPARKDKGSTCNATDPLAQVHREIAILKKLNHPNVVKLVEVLVDPSDDYLYIVFEFVERGCVMDIPTKEPLEEETAWSYFRDTLMGLEYLHYQKIVHRDLKPSNLLVSETGQIKIADFGVSSEFEGIDAFLTGTAGTPAFMAPEALQEDANQFYSGRAQDIWSLGITLYAFVYGQVPFWDPYVIALHKKIKTEPLVFPERPKISAELRDLISGMLNKNPARRLTLAEIRGHLWVTKSGQAPLPSEEENCKTPITVTEEEIRNSVRVIPSLGTLILVKSMGQRRRFGNPFRTGSSRRVPVISCRSTDAALSSETQRSPVSALANYRHAVAVRCASANPSLPANPDRAGHSSIVNGSLMPGDKPIDESSDD